VTLPQRSDPAPLDLALVLSHPAGAARGIPTHEEPWQALLADWLGLLRARLPGDLQAPAYSLGLELAGDARLADLNRNWRGRAGPTDVLSFAAREEAPPIPAEAGDDPLELGDIVISLDTAIRQAREAGHTPEEEVCWLACHGLLHLLGWDHPDDRALEEMLALQEALLRASGRRVSPDAPP
jgi:probable rRNA maturation factor